MSSYEVTSSAPSLIGGGSRDESLPTIFRGMNTLTFGDTTLYGGYGSSNKKGDNPFTKLKKVALDPTSSFQDRARAVRYMRDIPLYQSEGEVSAVLIEILKDRHHSLQERYDLIASNEMFMSFTQKIALPCHVFFFYTFRNENLAFPYVILSAQYILQNCPGNYYESAEPNRRPIVDAGRFLLDVALNTRMSINYRAEASDILLRLGNRNEQDTARIVIDVLGGVNDPGGVVLSNKNKMDTVYTDSQNIHDSSINSSVIAILRGLIREKNERGEKAMENRDSSRSGDGSKGTHQEVLEQIMRRITTYPLHGQEAVIKAFNRVIIDTARYCGLTLADVILLVWEKIVESPHRSEMEKRLIQELSEMNGTCSTGHLSRLINVLSGYYSPTLSEGGKGAIKISYDQQIRSNTIARLNASLKTLSPDDRDEILKQMTTPSAGSDTDSSSNGKSFLEEFVISYSPHDELFSEFVTVGKYVTANEFEKAYAKAIASYMGHSS